MIVYPANWQRNYEELDHPHTVSEIIEILYDILKQLDVNHLAYSGGIDSTIMLSIMSKLFKSVHTYTISSRENHPDVLFARIGSEHYNTTHHEFIVDPTYKETDIFAQTSAEKCRMIEIDLLRNAASSSFEHPIPSVLAAQAEVERMTTPTDH